MVYIIYIYINMCQSVSRVNHTHAPVISLDLSISQRTPFDF